MAVRVGYILLWFPERTQTFVLSEVNALVRGGLDVRVYTLYGHRSARRLAGLSSSLAPVCRLGLASMGAMLKELARFSRKRGRAGWGWLTRVLIRRWRGLEVAGEAWWAALAGILLARKCREDGITHLHAPWADGPATAAWVAAEIAALPFSFAGRAKDIYPPDGALAEKMAASRFVRVNNLANFRYLREQAPDQVHKVRLIYNGLTIPPGPKAPVPLTAPYRLLAIGRFAPTKGFDVLLKAAKILADEGLDCRLTLAGAGAMGPYLKILCRIFSLQDRVDFPGFIPHDRVPALLRSHDLLVVPSVVRPNGDRDGLPNVIMEALAAGLPVAATAVCGIPEVIQDGATGLLVQPRDPAALARTIRRLVEDRPKALDMAARGRELVLQHFDPAANARALARLFSDSGEALRQGVS